MVECVKRKSIQPAPEPTEYEGKPIIARLLVDVTEDIISLTKTKVSLSLKKSFFNQYEKSAYIDVIFINEPRSHSKERLFIYRYKMVSETEEAINFRLVCQL